MNKVESEWTKAVPEGESGAKGRRWAGGREVRASAPGLLHSLRKFPLHFPLCPPKIHAREEEGSQGTPGILEVFSLVHPHFIWGECKDLGSPRCPTSSEEALYPLFPWSIHDLTPTSSLILPDLLLLCDMMDGVM